MRTTIAGLGRRRCATLAASLLAAALLGGVTSVGAQTTGQTTGRPIAATVDGASGTATPVARTLGLLRERLRQAEAAVLNKDVRGASLLIEEVEAGLTHLRQTRSAEVGQGNVAAFVLEERIAVMKRQLATLPQAAGSVLR